MNAIATMMDGLRPRLEALLANGDDSATPIHFVHDDDPVPEQLPEAQAAWLMAQGWRGEDCGLALLPGMDGQIAGAVVGLGRRGIASCALPVAGSLPLRLPQGDYAFASGATDPELSAIAWLLGAYQFDGYRSETDKRVRRLVCPEGADRAKILRIAEAVWFGRDLINTPANDLGPEEIEAASRALGSRFGADVKVTEGAALLSENFPMIHAVGRASDRAPRLIDLVWGDSGAPKVTLIGKGVCFDTGGLNLKLGSSMGLMKKDMGGAAAALATAFMIMDAKLPVRLRLLIPAVENSLSGNAYRPGDILPSRAGIKVEIGNTDAEGRLVLADAIALACEEEPEQLFTMATLTGSARIALGPELPALFSADDGIAAGLAAAGASVADPMWRMPFWPPYDKLLKSKAADINHIAEGTFAGSIVAALFLRRFSKGHPRFTHLDLYGWTPRPMPGKPDGGEPQGARALYAFLEQAYPG